MMRVIGLAITTAFLAGCTGGAPSGALKKRIDRALAIAPGAGQPSKIVATEVAFERLARENGQWSAFAEYAAVGAVIHQNDGPVAATEWLSRQGNPPETARWNPRSVWISCDGSLALSKGRFRTPTGEVGDFVRVWQSSGPNEYQWKYHLAALDNPQPPPPPSDSSGAENEIRVTAFDTIQGFVADCPKRDVPTPAPMASPITDGVDQAGGVSRDRTLQWRWEHDRKGGRRIIAHYVEGGEWKLALDESMGPASAD